METDSYKNKLEEELALLEKELSSLGRRNPSNKEDWEATRGDIDTMPADENETADAIEEYEERSSELNQLEVRYNEVKEALNRIKENRFGNCVKCGASIEKDRLEANPAAPTCKLHMSS